MGCHCPKPHLAGWTEGACTDLTSGSYFWSGYKVVSWGRFSENFLSLGNMMFATLGVYV